MVLGQKKDEEGRICERQKHETKNESKKAGPKVEQSATPSHHRKGEK